MGLQKLSKKNNSSTRLSTELIRKPIQLGIGKKQGIVKMKLLLDAHPKPRLNRLLSPSYELLTLSLVSIKIHLESRNCRASSPTPKKKNTLLFTPYKGRTWRETPPFAIDIRNKGGYKTCLQIMVRKNDTLQKITKHILPM